VRKVLVTIANLFLPGSAQLARDEFAWGVTFAVGYGAALSVAVVSLVLAPALLSRAALALLFAGAFAFWLASQVLHLGALRSGRGDARAPGPEALAEVTRLWLRGEQAQALTHLEALLRRWPREPVLHFVAAQLWGEGTDEASRARARESLALCLACDLDGRWRRAAERELSLLAERGRGSGG
jgi:hypothetical protein